LEGAVETGDDRFELEQRRRVLDYGRRVSSIVSSIPLAAVSGEGRNNSLNIMVNNMTVSDLRQEHCVGRVPQLEMLGLDTLTRGMSRPPSSNTSLRASRGDLTLGCISLRQQSYPFRAISSTTSKTVI
jgi:hypothetical protein